MCSRLTICSITLPSSSSCPAPGRFTSTRMSRSSGGAQPVPASRRRSSSETRSPTPPICRCGSRPAPILPTSSRSKTSSARKASCISGSVTAASCWGIQGTHTSAKPGSAAAFRPRWIPAGCPTRCILDHTKNGIRRLTFGFQQPRNCFQGRSMPSRKWACRPTVRRAARRIFAPGRSPLPS